jgi:hypothetical protein
MFNLLSMYALAASALSLVEAEICTSLRVFVDAAAAPLLPLAACVF